MQDLVIAMTRGGPRRVLPSIAGSGPEEINSPAGLTIRAWALERIDRAEEARVLLTKTLTGGLEWLPADGNRLPSAALVVTAAKRLDLPEAAELALGELEPYDDDRLVVDRAVAWGSVCYFLGVAAWTLGRLDAAEERLLQAIDQHRRLGAPVLLAAAQADLARVLGERGWAGDRPRRDRLIAEATTAADGLGLEGLRAELAVAAES